MITHLSDGDAIFGRLSGQAQFAFFPALQRAYKDDAPSIGTEHLLAGLMLADRPLFERIFSSAHVASMRTGLGISSLLEIHDQAGVERKGLKLRSDLKGILAAAQTRAESLGEPSVGIRHLLLEIMRKKNCAAAETLTKCGVDLAKSAKNVESAELSPEVIALRNKLVTHFQAREKTWGVTVMSEVPMWVRPAQVCAPFLLVAPGVIASDVAAPGAGPPRQLFSVCPFLCLEIVTEVERMSALMKRVSEYLAAGTRYVWLLSPTTGHAYSVTAETGLREVKAVLRTEGPVLEMPLAEIFEQD